MPTYDLAAKIVTKTQRVFVVHAGRERRNHLDFVRNGVAYLEIPSIDLTADILRSTASIRRAIRRQQQRFRFSLDPVGTPRPLDDLSSYSAAPLQGSGISSLAGSINSLYKRMKVGDIVITPGFETIGKYKRPTVHFGEIAAEFDPTLVHTGNTSRTARVPYRQVRWLSSVPRSAIPPQLEAKIGRPPAVREILLTAETEDILNFTYSNYIYEGGSASLVRAPRYQGSEFPSLVDSSRLIEILVAAYAFANENSAIADAVDIPNLEAFRHTYFALSGVESISVEFSSPGFWRIVGGTATMAAFVALGIAIFTTSTVSSLDKGVAVENTVSQSTSQEEEIQASMNMFLRSLTLSQKKEMTGNASNAKEKIGLSSSVRKTQE